MFFYEKTQDKEDFPYNNYEVLCGIEEEFFILSKDGTLREAADDIMEQAAKLLDKDENLLETLKLKIRSLDAEPSPSQIEYVTLPLPPKDLEDAVKMGRNLLVEAASKLGLKIFAQTLHPIQSNPNPIVGTHINISIHEKNYVMKPNELKAVYNYLWNYLPELIGISANSPIYQGEKTGIACNRYVKSNVLKPNGPAKFKQPEKGPALVQMQYYGRLRYNLRIGSGEDEFEKSVIANPRGARLVDISPRGPSTNVGDDKDESPSRNRVEVRIIDVQQDIKDLLDLAYLCCASAYHALFLNSTGKLLIDPYHETNVKAAVENGHNAIFKRKNNSNESISESTKRWYNEIDKFQQYLGVTIESLPVKKFKKEMLQRELSINFRTREIEKLRRRGQSYAEVRLGDSRIVSDDNANKYRVQGGARIHGNLSSDYNLEYEEKDGIVTTFSNITVINILEVQGLKIPLQEDDRILNTLSQTDYLTRRLFGGLGF
ncbi:MAG: hypothetical protein EU543_02495 [Promethearchaeota archaeon]|nr:MAG: hypothetical protein EU543_02495 [Candidatus Lokiarchaeota archaeon]